MSIRTNPHCKPNLLVWLVFVVGAGVASTGVAQANEASSALSSGKGDGRTVTYEKWWQSVWGLDLARKLKEWRPMVTVRDDGEGLNLARPFGKSGPTVQCSSSLPDSVVQSLSAGGDSGIGIVGRDTDIFLFLQKRW
jgi:hypothetical protein